ncbi:MAG: hypothetical protein PHI11_00555 [Gallionella sp.]|nr:hypothetical protein [Gallionella sp.]MDD4959706.1 hypothetical protein [Gallionella sp.]MDD4962386.1 hypothetical protein [Gallionella sp.]
MKKLSVLAFTLAMAVSGSVFAAPTVGIDTTVDGVKYTHGTEGVSTETGHTFSHSVTVNGQSFPAGTKFNVIKMSNGAYVPTAANGVAIGPMAGGAAAGGAAGGAVAGGTAGGLTAGGLAVAGGAAVVGAAVVSNTSTTTHTP